MFILNIGANTNLLTVISIGKKLMIENKQLKEIWLIYHPKYSMFGDISYILNVIKNDQKEMEWYRDQCIQIGQEYLIEHWAEYLSNGNIYWEKKDDQIS